MNAINLKLTLSLGNSFIDSSHRIYDLFLRAESSEIFTPRCTFTVHDSIKGSFKLIIDDENSLQTEVEQLNSHTLKSIFNPLSDGFCFDVEEFKSFFKHPKINLISGEAVDDELTRLIKNQFQEEFNSFLSGTNIAAKNFLKNFI